MAPTRTIRNKHAKHNSGIKNSRAAKAGPSGGDSVIVKSKRNQGKLPASQLNSGRSRMLELLQKRRKQRTYSEKDLDIPKLNTITPVGVQKPKGKKKGKVFVDDKAEKDGQIESKIMKSRQMEEIRQARLVEAEKKDAERQAKLDETKASLRKKRQRSGGRAGDNNDDEGVSIGSLAAAGTRAAKVKPKKKRVAFAGPATD